jgi:hypothetical protein
MIATCFHFAYGIWLFAAKWGITPGDKARRRFGWVCAVFGIAICAMGLASIYAFVGPMYPNAPDDAMPAQTSTLIPGAVVVASEIGPGFSPPSTPPDHSRVVVASEIGPGFSSPSTPPTHSRVVVASEIGPGFSPPSTPPDHSRVVAAPENSAVVVASEIGPGFSPDIAARYRIGL